MTGTEDSMLWVMAANILVWLGIGGYVAFLARRQSALAARVKQMEIMGNGNQI